MEPLFETKTIMTWEEYKKMSDYDYQKMFRTELVCGIAFLFSGIGIVLLGECVNGILVGTIGILYILMGIYGRNIMPKKQYSIGCDNYGNEITVKFYDDSLTVFYETCSLNVGYGELAKIAETDTNFYIYKSKHVIVANVLKENCTEDLIWFLRGKKYEH